MRKNSDKRKHVKRRKIGKRKEMERCKKVSAEFSSQRWKIRRYKKKWGVGEEKGGKWREVDGREGRN